jgi:hypothetical protein
VNNLKTQRARTSRRKALNRKGRKENPQREHWKPAALTSCESPFGIPESVANVDVLSGTQSFRKESQKAESSRVLIATTTTTDGSNDK